MGLYVEDAINQLVAAHNALALVVERLQGELAEVKKELESMKGDGR